MMLFLTFVLISGFVQVGYIDRGGGDPRVLAGDLDRDSLTEIIFLRNENPFIPKIDAIWFYEQTQYNSFNFVPKDTIIVNTDTGCFYCCWEKGDFDLDGKYDLITHRSKINISGNGPIIYESIDSFSYPKQIVWEDTSHFPPTQSVFDADKDGIPEIFTTRFCKKIHGQTVMADFAVYEFIEDNKYKLIFLGDTNSLDMGPASQIVFGDFDGDSLIEFVYGGVDGDYKIWECTGNNTYERQKYGQLNTANIFDCISVNDADQDGKMEFVLKGDIPQSNQFQVYIFEATGDNQYQIVKYFSFPEKGVGYSASGDVDGDGIPEIVLLTRYIAYIIKADGDNNFYVWDIVGSIPSDGISGSTLIYDIDKDGLNEIILSSYYCTKIFKYQQGVEENPISIIPNSELKIKTILKNMKLPTSISIYNISGRKINEIFEIKDLPKGIYWIKLKKEGETFKIIKF